MKAIAVIPGTADSIHLRDVPQPHLNQIPNERGVIVRVISVGVDGTDKEINAAEYGKAPAGDEYLITGHESFGIVESVGKNVTEVKPGDHVVAMVRRPGHSIYDTIGRQDMTTDSEYYERGINLLHGFLSEFYIEKPEYLIPVPSGLGELGVLTEPTSVIEKGIAQAYEIQRRLGVWQPKRALVLGAGTIGLLATMALRIRGLEVTVCARRTKPYKNASLAEQIGATYSSLEEHSIEQLVKRRGPFDIVFEATGFAPLLFQGADALNKNGVLILSGVSGGMKTTEVAADKLNLEFVLGNKVMVGTVNASRADFEAGVKDLCYAELAWPGWLQQFLTPPVSGLENFREMIRLLTEEKSAIKVFVRIANQQS